MFHLFQIIALLIALGSSFVLGLALSYSASEGVNLVRQVELSVASAFEYPETVVFRQINRYEYRKVHQGEQIAYLCGEAAQTFSPTRQWRYQFQRFIVKVIETPYGETTISLPLIEGDEALFSAAQFNVLWQRTCH